MTGVLLLGWLLTTTMFVNVTLPVLLTLPPKVNKKPGGTGSKHDLVTLMPVVRVFTQTALVELVIPPGGRQFVNESLPVAVNVFVLGMQGFKETQNPCIPSTNTFTA